jgi:hypothetical protein
MTEAKPKSEFYKDTTIPNALLDELMNQLPAMPTQEDIREAFRRSATTSLVRFILLLSTESAEAR